MNRFQSLLVVLTTLLVYSAIAQNKVDFSVSNYMIKKSSRIEPSSLLPDFAVSLYNLEAPVPGGTSEKSYILSQKIKSRKLYPVKYNWKKSSSEKAMDVSLGSDFGMYKKLPNGNEILVYGGRPNDNTLAVSNDGVVLVGMNSTIYAYDTETTNPVLSNQFISLSAMATGISGSNFFDPKIIYDEQYDRFILVFLKDNTPAASKVIVCFSSSSNPDDPWNVYALPGNPFNNDRWTDFPAIAITETDLFFTGNLIVPNEPWQTGFDGSIIWQINKKNGFDGDSILTTKLYNDIKFDNSFVRNLHPVQGANGVTDELYLLSNRNFDITNDSVFILKLEGTSLDSSTNLSIDVYKTDLAYGVPPNGRQEDTDTTDATSGLQTNDGRVLGAIKIDDQIQFVSNTINPETGLSAIYHGTINELNGNRSVTGTIIADSVKDFGYPNIAWTGNEPCDIETVIGFNYTSITDYPGIACVYYDNERKYSNVIVTKEGEGYVDRSLTTNERWGDYFGLQRKYNEPGKVFSFGYYGTLNQSNTGWCTEIISPDTTQLYLSFERKGQASLCEQIIHLNVYGGVPPYLYFWGVNSTNSSADSDPICLGDSIVVSVVDARGCSVEKTISAEIIDVNEGISVYPNPTQDWVVVQFSLEEKTLITAKIFDVRGRLLVDLVEREMESGLNELTFSTDPLSIGEYLLVILNNGNKIITEKIIKN